MEKWAGKLAVVTGASSGIGEAIVKAFAINGINVVGLARRSEKVEEIAANLVEAPGKVYARKCDVLDLESVKEAFKWIESEFGSINIHINNAGIAKTGKIISETDDATEKLEAVINTNFTGLVRCSREAIRLIKKSNDFGMIVNISSILGDSTPYVPAEVNLYPATKHAVRAVSETLRQELIIEGNDKIRVSNVSPGGTKTNILVASGRLTSTEEYYKIVPHVKAEDVAQTILFLLQTPYSVNITQLTVKPVGEKM